MMDGLWFHRATPRGEGGIAVFELLGAGSGECLARVFRPRGGQLPGAGRLRLGDFVDLAGDVIDEGLVARVESEAAWSRLTSWSLSLHGGPWIQEKAAAVFRALGGVELDLRGVLRLSIREGGLDCIEAAAYELLIDARTERAACFFARQHSGEVSALIREGLENAERGRVAASSEIASRLLRHSEQAIRLGHPLRVLIAGPPNAGKSTLFNRLVEEERAVVSSIPGTTRDTLEATVALEGIPIVLCDSAGIRDPAMAGEVERLGIERAFERDDDAALYLLPPPWQPSTADRSFIDRWPADRLCIVASLADLGGGHPPPPHALLLSTRTGDGLERLKRNVVDRWISQGQALTLESPPAAFTPRLARILKSIAESASPDPGSLDAVLDAHRKAYIECRDSSWP